MLGVLATLFTQSSNKDSRDDGPAAGSSTATRESVSPEPAATTDPSGAADASDDPADGDLTTLSPSPSQTAVAKILKTGDFTLPEGHSADLEHGNVGESVKAPDMSWPGGVSYSAMNGRVGQPRGGATAKTCAAALTDDDVAQTVEISDGSEGLWYCMPTSANHLAAVEWLGTGEKGERFHYIVWDVPAPSSDDS
ncbi:hypothetical protein GTY65_38650 [Streptomyces sp. SID8379]|uniref:hypothetical protein n=1 Tax=unclassified Streptomyces TaxID=2593676 RepID=UPI00037903D7|nr:MULTISPECIES: hypothetical protein [unclassified Streptomyces]MYW69933.1 hypothetical protein [Streptomyces sp. SID8379]